MGARCARGPCASKPTGGSPSSCVGSLPPRLPRRLLSGCPPPTLQEEVERETEGADGRSEGPAGGAGRCPPASARVTPPGLPPLGAGLAGGRGCRAALPRQALAALKSRRTSVPGVWDQILHPDRCLRSAPRAGRSLS